MNAPYNREVGKGSRVCVGVVPHPVPAEACADGARRVASDAGDSAGQTPASPSRRRRQIRAGWGVRQTGFGGGQVAAPCPHYQTAGMPTGDAVPRREQRIAAEPMRDGKLYTGVNRKILNPAQHAH